MGIKGLPSTINGCAKRDIPSLNYNIPAADLAGKRVYVDVNAVFFAYWNSQARSMCESDTNILENGINYDRLIDQWKASVVRTVRTWTSIGIVITLVLDGQAPFSKEGTQSSRREDREAYMVKASEAVKAICELCNVPYQERALTTGPITIPFKHAPEVERQRIIHRDALKNCIDPIKSNWQSLMDTLIVEGFTCIQANVEAETLCCKAVLTGDADYVLSSDSDCLAYGIPVWLRDWDYKDRSFRAVNLVDVVDRIGIPPERFQDYCIMCGCDYNKRVTHKKDGRAVRMGEVNVGVRLKEKSLDDIMMDDSIDWSVLNVDFCRSVFGLQIHVAPMSLQYSSDILIV